MAVDDAACSRNIDLQQRALEIQSIMRCAYISFRAKAETNRHSVAQLWKAKCGALQPHSLPGRIIGRANFQVLEVGTPQNSAHHVANQGCCKFGCALRPAPCTRKSCIFACSVPPATRLAALPADASAEDVEVDPRLPFLDAYVRRALENGAAPYILGVCLRLSGLEDGDGSCCRPIPVRGTRRRIRRQGVCLLCF